MILLRFARLKPGGPRTHTGARGHTSAQTVRYHGHEMTPRSRVPVRSESFAVARYRRAPSPAALILATVRRRATEVRACEVRE